jgi:hypothetical protein
MTVASFLNMPPAADKAMMNLAHRVKLARYPKKKPGLKKP